MARIATTTPMPPLPEAGGIAPTVRWTRAYSDRKALTVR